MKAKPYKPKSTYYPFKVFLGVAKNTNERIILTGFEWACDWYWGGGYVGNKNLHCHFDGCFLNRPDDRGHPLGLFTTPWNKKPGHAEVSNGYSVWEPLEFFLNDAPPHLIARWWRIKDLYKQFYALRKAAEVFRLGGHCTTHGRTPREVRPGMENQINRHIENVIIPAIVKEVNP